MKQKTKRFGPIKMVATRKTLNGNLTGWRVQATCPGSYIGKFGPITFDHVATLTAVEAIDHIANLHLDALARVMCPGARPLVQNGR